MHTLPCSMGVLVALAVAGCGAGSPVAPLDAMSSDASASDVAVLEAPDAAGLCAVAAPSTAPVITDSYTASPMPAMATLGGGVIPPGTYFHVQQINFGAATGPTHHRQTTVVVDASSSTAILTGMIDGMPLVAAERLEFQGNVMAMKIACPAPLLGMIDTVGYAVVGERLFMYAYDENTESIFERQP